MPAYKSSNWRGCYLEFEQEFLRYADQTRNCGHLNDRSGAAKHRRAQKCVRDALRFKHGFRTVQHFFGDDEALCQLIIGDQTGSIFQLHLFSNIYTDHGQFAAFQCQDVRIVVGNLFGVTAENCEKIEAETGSVIKQNSK